MATNTPLQSVLLTSSTSTITFSNIDQSYTDLVLVISAKCDAGFDIWVRCNGDSASNYSYTVLTGNGTTASSERSSNVTEGLLTDWWGTPTNTFAGHLSTVTLNNYSNTITFKTSMARSGRAGSGLDFVLSTWRNTAAITSLTLRASNASRTFDAGTTVDLYGIKSGAPKAMGGDLVTTDGNYWYHTFRSSGTFLLQQPTSVDYLVVAGGGAGGGYGGGGGAGGFRTSAGTSGANSAAESALSMSPGSYTVVVGAGGAITSTVNATGAQGSNSSISGTGITTVTSTGGGGGAGETPGNGGSGGGGSGTSSGTTVGLGTALQGRNGGQGSNDTIYYGGGGGGGASAVGSNFASSTQGGAGGAGQASSISGSSVTYAGGGGGGTWYNYNGGAGGAGGGGAGSAPDSTAGSGTANTGGGGGGSGSTSGSSGSLRTEGAGGSGIVIVRYAV